MVHQADDLTHRLASARWRIAEVNYAEFNGHQADIDGRRGDRSHARGHARVEGLWLDAERLLS
jgi:hypothetical protein